MSFTDQYPVDQLQVMLDIEIGPDGSTLSSEDALAITQAISDRSTTATTPPDAGPAAAQEGDTDLARMIEAQVAKAMQAVGGPAPAPAQQGITFDQVLSQIDPRDSDTALAMLEFLTKTGRLSAIGSLNGGGYLYHYQEPKGASKAGYMPGGTAGGRMVDKALEKAEQGGIKAREVGICDKCFSTVVKKDDGTVVHDDPSNADPGCHGGTHNFQAI